MLNQAKSSADPHRTPAEGTLAPSPTQPEVDQRPHPAALARSTKADEPLYTIRIVANPGTQCAACGKQETGCGPVGFLDDAAICDLCLLEGSDELGMVLALISVVRAYANVRGTAEEWQSALEELGAFARIYDRFAAKTGPARIIKFFRENDTTN